jgi:hypothetical protein
MRRRVVLVVVGLIVLPSLLRAEVCPGSKVLKANLTSFEWAKDGDFTDSQWASKCETPQAR